MLALVGGFITAVYPPLAASVGADDALLTMLGLLALLLAVRAIQQRRRAERVVGEPPTPEIGLQSAVPGDEIDEDIGRLARGSRRRTIGGRREIHDRIGELAISVLMRRERCSRDEAIDLLETGEWTDDPIAASFLGTVRPPYRLQLRAAFSSEPRFSRRTRRTIDELYRIVEETREGNETRGGDR